MASKRDRVLLIKMKDDTNPISPGTKGTVFSVIPADVAAPRTYVVDWDNGKRQQLIEGWDEFEVIGNLLQ